MSLSVKHDPAILALREKCLREFSQKTPEQQEGERKFVHEIWKKVGIGSVRSLQEILEDNAPYFNAPHFLRLLSRRNFIMNRFEELIENIEELHEVLEKECDEYETREAAMVLASLREAKQVIEEAQMYYKKVRGAKK